MNNSSSQREQCAVCGKDVADTWFARIRNGAGWVKVCRPACSIRYTDGPQPADNDGERRPHFLVSAELWS